MGGKKHKNPKPAAAPPPAAKKTIAHLVAGIVKAPVALSFLWPVLLVTGGYLAWHRWGAEQINRRYNALQFEQVKISPVPDYIRSDIVESVFRATDLTKVSLLDTQATAQIANAFAINPWIESVTRVQKSAGNVEVHVNYRRPVAMVEVFSRHPDVKGLAYLPVDGNSVLLPTEDFSRADTHDYIHIVVKDAYPISDFGSKFGDTRVADAALLASLLVNYRKSLGIVAITIDERSRQDDGPPALNLVLKDGSQIRWGSPPGKELGNEPHTSEKMRVLLSNSKSNDLDVLVAQPADDGYLQR